MTVLFASGPKRSAGRTGGRKKFFFNSRRRCSHGPWRMRQWNPVHSWPGGSPGDRLGSYVNMVSRLHRMRRRFEGLSANSLNTPSHSSMNYLAMASRALGGPKRRRMRRRRLPTTRPTPSTSRSRSAPEKSVQFGPDGTPFPSKTSLRAPPIVSGSVSLDEYYPSDSGLQVYDIGRWKAASIFWCIGT